MNHPLPTEAADAVERVAREAYGRLLAYLSVRSRDVAGAEDSLGDALLAALTTWPRDGVPANPEAWLLTAARRRMTDEFRRREVRDRWSPALEAMIGDSAAVPEPNGGAIPDDRLKLMFLCAHPAIDPGIRTPLMLQTVLGLDASRIASAFLVAPAAMSQRLVRAKAKIRLAGIPFEVPDDAARPERLVSVLEAIYAAYGTGWEDVEGSESGVQGLATEAVWLARVLAGLLPGDAEARGLLALLLYCESRRRARRAPDGSFVPLSGQDVRLWIPEILLEAERELSQAARLAAPGRFQLEAAIQSVHAARRFTGRTEWGALVRLYEGLMRLAPTWGAQVSLCAALGEAVGPAEALERLEGVPADVAATYQPYWAVRAHLLARAGRVEEAREGYRRAIGLSMDDAVRRFLMQRAQQLDAGNPEGTSGMGISGASGAAAS